MTRFILVTFAFLAWSFWLLSGGSDYAPRVVAEPIFAPAMPLEDRPRGTETASLFPTSAESPAEGAQETTDPALSLAERLEAREETAALQEQTDLVVQAALDSGIDAPDETNGADRLSVVFGAQSILDISNEGLSAVGVAPGEAGALTGQAMTIATFGTSPSASPPPVSPVAVATPEPDLRAVSADSVNMRSGPGTSFSVITRLSQGDAVEVLGAEMGSDFEDWLRLRIVETGEIGYMAAWLITERAE